MRLMLWIVIFIGTLAGASFGYYKFRQSQMIAHPAYIEEFKREAMTQEPAPVYTLAASSPLNPDRDEDCEQLIAIDWPSILSNHTFLNGLRREDIKPDTVWTLKLSLLAFLGMEYEMFEVETLSANSVTYHRLEYGAITEALNPSETHDFAKFRQRLCGMHRVHPLLYVASDLGQIALPIPDGFVDLFMDRAEFRILMGQRINKRFRLNINQSNWTIDDFLALMEQP